MSREKLNTYDNTRQRSFTVAQKAQFGVSDLEKFKNYSTRRPSNLQRNSSVKQVGLPPGDKTVRRVSQMRRDSSYKRSKVTGFFATQGGSTSRRNSANNEAQSSTLNQQNGGAMFTRTQSNGRRTITNSKSLPPTQMTFGKYTTTNTIARDSSRRSLSVTHGRGQELDESPSRLSKIMSQKEFGSDKKGLNMQVRKASISSMKNNMLLDRKASM